MKQEEIPDLNIFMICEKLNENALTNLSEQFTIRNCRPNELDIWKAFPFDDEKTALEYKNFMTDYFTETYSHNPDLFFNNTLFVCDKDDKPIATCSYWKAYNKFNTIQWFKTLKTYEGKGIGRALLSEIFKRFKPEDFPVYLHTQPGSFRAIKLYSDFGFSLLSGKQAGNRSNGLEQCLPILKEFIPIADFNNLKIVESPESFLEAVKNQQTFQF